MQLWCSCWPACDGHENEAIRLILYIELYALRERKLYPEIDSVRGAMHVGFLASY
jgi:hypothetical protein